MHKTEWTPERIEKLRNLWPTPATAADIAKQLGGGLSKNAVIGKAGRLGLKPRVSGRLSKSQLAARKTTSPFGQRNRRKPDPKPAPPKTPVDALRAQAAAMIPAEPIIAREDLPPLVASVLDLESHHCRWIPGEPAGGFCGREKVIGLPYCECHALRAFDFTKPRRRGGSGWVPGQALGLAKADSARLADVSEFVDA